MIGDNKQLMLRMLAAFASGDESEGRAIVSPEYIGHQDERGIGEDGLLRSSPLCIGATPT